MHRFLLVLGSMLVPVAASAQGVPCSKAESGAIFVDGKTSDWQGVPRATFSGRSLIAKGVAGWSGAKDLSVEVACNHNAGKLLLLLRVHDDNVVGLRDRKKGDRVRLAVAGLHLQYQPGDGSRAGRVSIGKRPARGVDFGELKLADGYGVELAIPWRMMRRYRRKSPNLPFGLQIIDSDHWRGKRQSTLKLRSSIVFAQAQADLKALLSDLKVARRDVRWKKLAHVVGDRAVEQVLWLGDKVAIVGEGLPGGRYFYFSLPVRNKTDVKWVKLVDLDGDRQKEIIVRFTQRASNGSRDLLQVYRFNSVAKFGAPYTQELTKQQGGNSIVNRVRLVKRRRKRGTDIVIDQATATGFTQQNYREAPDDQIYTILLPWKAPKKRRVIFDGDEFSVKE